MEVVDLSAEDVRVGDGLELETGEGRTRFFKVVATLRLTVPVGRKTSDTVVLWVAPDGDPLCYLAGRRLTVRRSG